MWVGIDGCRGGWFAIGIAGTGEYRAAVDRTMDDVWQRWQGANLILVDIPIGLTNEMRERECDLRARQFVGGRRSSVFPAPSRAALAADSYGSASEMNREASGRGLSQQSWAIVRKIAEVDALLRANELARRRVREVHPEVLFCALNGARPLRNSKKRRAGFNERLEILTRLYPPAAEIAAAALKEHPRKVVARDDVLDALAAAVTGLQSAGDLKRLPEQLLTDSTGLPMEMVYWVSAEQPR